LSIYNYPEIYDIAFNYRDIFQECDFIEKKINLFLRTENSSVLDIACGTGCHIVELINRGYEVDGFDISPKMIEYATNKLTTQGLHSNLWIDNMASFKCEKKYGIAINILTGFNYLLTNNHVLSHLQSVADGLDSGGIYIIELNHPREFIVNKPSKTNAWIETVGDIEVEVDWDNERSSVDIITHQITSSPIIKVKDGNNSFTITMKDKYRIFLYQEMLLMIAQSNLFETLGTYGSFMLDNDFDNSKDSWRMIFVLRRK